jgi:hypothetical protein
VTSAKTSHVSSAEATHVTSAEATHLGSTEATHMTSAETTHVTSSAKAAAVSTAAATASTSCLCTRRKQRPGKHGACQYHHHSSCSHDIFLSTDRAISSLPNMLLYGRAKMRLVFDQQHSISSRLLNAIQQS